MLCLIGFIRNNAIRRSLRILFRSVIVENIMTTKQRAYLKGLAMTMDPIIQIGKSSLTPEVIEAVREAIDKRELIKISVLKNCFDDPRELAQIVAERTHSEVVQVIGKKIVLYKQAKENSKITLP